MQRRAFITLVGGAAATWPLAARAQQPERVRHIAMLTILGSDDPEAQARTTVFEQTLQQLGWVVGRNLKIDIRRIGVDVDRLRSDAAELVALAPDVILTMGSVAIAPLQQDTRTIPIVFVNVPDPVGAGFVQSMAHPGGNITGFSNFEYSMSGKWAELLKQIAPNVTRALVFRDPTSAAGIGQFGAVRSVAQSLGVELTPLNVRDTDEIERNVAAFARSGNGGVIVTAGGSAVRRELIIRLAARYKLPSVYLYRYYAVDGGLITYGPNTLDPVRRAAGYVDRILKGEKPADMPVQAPTKYELIINLKTAKALGLTIPQSLLSRLMTPLRTRGARVHCPTMPQHIGYIALLVRDYDEAICYFVEKLGFTVAEDTDHGGGKRWVLVAPPGSVETRLVLAKAVSADELARVGNQTGGRVFLFLHTDDFSRDYQAYRSSGVLFREEPREEQYGVVAVFVDLYGNRWDLLELKR